MGAGKHENETTQERLIRRIFEVLNIEAFFVVLTFFLIAADVYHHWSE